MPLSYCPSAWTPFDKDRGTYVHVHQEFTTAVKGARKETFSGQVPYVDLMGGIVRRTYPARSRRENLGSVIQVGNALPPASHSPSGLYDMERHDTLLMGS